MPPTPPLPGAPNILPRQPGESAYAYRNRRSIVQTGETLYQRRQRLGQARGVSVSEARGHAAVGGQTEYQRRREQTLQRTGLTPSQLRTQQLDLQLQQMGYTTQNTGMSQTNLRRILPRLRWINENTTPGGQLTPDIILEATDMERTGDVPRGWAYDHINQRYESMYEFKVMGNNQPGNFVWFRERPEYDGALSANWWYYH